MKNLLTVKTEHGLNLKSIANSPEQLKNAARSQLKAALSYIEGASNALESCGQKIPHELPQAKSNLEKELSTRPSVDKTAKEYADKAKEVAKKTYTKFQRAWNAF